MPAGPDQNPSFSEIPQKNLMFKTAIFGFGKMGRLHREFIDSSGLASVVAVADPALVPEGIPGKDAVEFFSDPAKLLVNIRPDVVHIVTPPGTHFELARMALMSGSHVYVEKPFTATSSEAKELFSIAAGSGLKVCAGHQLLHHQVTIKAGPLLAGIGQIVHIESFFSFRQVRKDISAAEQLLDILPHPVYLFLHFLEKSGARLEEICRKIKGIDARDDGELRLLLADQNVTGSITVTLKGRPVDSFVKLIGTEGSLALNYVRGTAVKSDPGTIALLTSPYTEAVKTVFQSGATLARAALSRKSRCQGLGGAFAAFYESILENSAPPVSEQLITECAAISELAAREMDASVNKAVSPSLSDFVIVTGGTGFLGHRVVSEILNSGRGVRVLARKLPPRSERIPGADYRRADLSREPDMSQWEGAAAVVHCAAATYGDRPAHEKNTVTAARNVMQAAARAGIGKIVHVSSLGILKSGTSGNNGAPISESTPVHYGDTSRGPYVWAKIEAERIMIEEGKRLGLACRIIRPGPLVDLASFRPPGRLGRRIGPFFVAVGQRQSGINICSVGTAARVIARCVVCFEKFPAVLNLVEAPPPTRASLVELLMRESPGIKVVWAPDAVVGTMSGGLKILFRLVRPGKQPPDIKKIFASEKYDLSLAFAMMKEIQENA